MSDANNHALQIGNLGRDPILRETQSGQPVCNFTLAVDDAISKHTNWIPVVVWGGLAKTCAEYLQKGSLVAVAGRIQTRTYTAANGEERSTFELVAESVKFLGKIKGKNQDAQQNANP